MPEVNYTFLSAFSHAILPRVLFDQSDDQCSMLLARRYACPLLQHLWKQAAESMGVSDAAGGETIDTSAVWLGGSLASLVVTFPAPQNPGEAHRALFVIPARPSDGPRRYFLLEREARAAGQRSAAVAELVDDSAAATGFRRIEQRTGVDANPEAFTAAVEQITGTAREPKIEFTGDATCSPPPATENSAPGPQPWWKFWG